MKSKIRFPDGTEMDCDVSKKGVFAVHKPTDPSEKKGYVITEVSSCKVVCWKRLKAEAIAKRNELEN